MLLTLLFAKVATEKEYDNFHSTKPSGVAICQKDYLFKTLFCKDRCLNYDIGCQRMVDDIDQTYSYKKQGTVTYNEINCPIFWNCNKKHTCPADRIVSGVKCAGWKCRKLGVYCDKLTGPNGPPKIGTQCYWTDKISKTSPYKECDSGYAVKSIACLSWLCKTTKLECCPIEQVNQNCEMSLWGEWSKCSSNSQMRHKTIIKKSTGNGTPCSATMEHQACQECIVGDWLPWSTCQNDKMLRIRKVIKVPFGQVAKCPHLQETVDCKPPVKEKDCKVSQWSQWSKCSNRIQSRTRKVTQYPTKNGIKCPVLKETKKCCIGNGYAFKHPHTC